jgi:cystathionine beta-synthase
VIGIDTYGSVFKKYKETGIFDKDEIFPYITEGIGEDFLPQNVNFELIDHFEKVTDKDAALMTREVALKEGIFAGNSTGSAVAGVLQLKDMFKEGDVVVIIFPDHGSRYMGKMYNEDWLRERGFLKDEKLTAKDIIRKKESQEIITIDCEKSILEAINVIKSLNISQIPVTQKGMVIGKITESGILDALLENPALKSYPVQTITTASFPFVDLNTSIDKISAMINKDNIAVLIEDQGKIEIITQYDIINAISA